MNEELEPLGYPLPADVSRAETLSELVAEHPLVALAASAAVGAGLMALVAAVARQGAGSARAATDTSQATHVYDELRGQLAKLAERVNASLPDRSALAQTLSDLGTEAASTLDSASDLAKRSMHSAMATGAKATQAAADHPLLTSLVVGAIGAVAAAMAASGKESSNDESAEPRPNGQDTDSPLQAPMPTP